MVLVESIFEHGKELVVTVGENVESTPPQEDLDHLAHAIMKRLIVGCCCM
jgi:hypothetical protein